MTEDKKYRIEAREKIVSQIEKFRNGPEKFAGKFSEKICYHDANNLDHAKQNLEIFKVDLLIMIAESLESMQKDIEEIKSHVETIG